MYVVELLVKIGHPLKLQIHADLLPLFGGNFTGLQVEQEADLRCEIKAVGIAGRRSKASSLRRGCVDSRAGEGLPRLRRCRPNAPADRCDT